MISITYFNRSNILFLLNLLLSNALTLNHPISIKKKIQKKFKLIEA